MAELRRLALGLAALYVVILANIGTVDGDLLTTTVAPLVGDNEETTMRADWNRMVAEGEMEESSGVLPTEAPVECECNCEEQCRDCLRPEDCPTLTTQMPNDDVVVTTTTVANVEEETTVAVPTQPPMCSTPGVETDASNCHAYHLCSSVGFPDGNNHLVTKMCASNEAYSARFGRCARDISSCFPEDFCMVKGGFADALSNTSYYLCEPRLIGGGFHVFHVKCSPHQIFYPELGKCFLDLANLPQTGMPLHPSFTWNLFEDIDVVKAELKLIKEQDKQTLKLEKDRLKAEKKRQKEEQKLAEERAKEEEKLHKAMVKQESLTFVCPSQGAFPSSVSDSYYFMCLLKKDTLKAEVMHCPVGSKFNTVTGFCALDTLQVPNDSVSEDDDE
ncbi:mucin related 18B [Haematobia irritans]|uniref:Putative chitin binding peritrophin-a n=1 Tax=Haematobia irritans TaxID=7368 RepID=A0A1L8EII0_HAEIR